MGSITNLLESSSAPQDIQEQCQNPFGSTSATSSTGDISLHHLQSTFNTAHNAVLVGSNSADSINQKHSSAMKTNTTDNDSSRYFQFQPGEAIFKYKIMEDMYKKNNPGNREVVNNMCSASDFEVFQGLAGYLENNSVEGSSTAIELTKTAAKHCLALSEPQTIATLPSSDRNFSGNCDGLDLAKSKKPNLEQAPIATVESTAGRLRARFGQITSIFRGVTKHRWTGRFEAHLWDKSDKGEGQCRKGRQGGYNSEEKAARAYDLACIKYWGPSARTNFPVRNYENDLEEMKHKSKEEFVNFLRRIENRKVFSMVSQLVFLFAASIERSSNGFSRGASVYRGVTRHHRNGRWLARIGRVGANSDLYLGTYGTQEEAAEAYDIATIKYRGENAVTNFDINKYDVQKIINNALPVERLSKRIRIAEDSAERAENKLKFEEQTTMSSDAEPTMYGNAAGAFAASNERPHVGSQQQENPRMTSYQEGRQWQKKANENHLVNLISQQDLASYEKHLQQFMFTPVSSTLQYNLMGLKHAATNGGSRTLADAGIYRDISGNSAAKGFPLTNSCAPSVIGNFPAAHFINTSNGSVALRAVGDENMFQQSPCLSEPGYENLTGNNGMALSAQYLQPRHPTHGE